MARASPSDNTVGSEAEQMLHDAFFFFFFKLYYVQDTHLNFVWLSENLRFSNYRWWVLQVNMTDMEVWCSTKLKKNIRTKKD